MSGILNKTCTKCHTEYPNTMKYYPYPACPVCLPCHREEAYAMYAPKKPTKQIPTARKGSISGRISSAKTALYATPTRIKVASANAARSVTMKRAGMKRPSSIKTS